jgi:pimeloyl-ACP methyl ester carboxylesterase
MIRRSILALAVSWLLVTPAGIRAEEHSFDSGGVKIHYLIEGKGEPVLLIHGFAANTTVQWALPGIIRSLARDYQVIALDNRGHGRSDKPHDPKDYGMEMVEDAVRLLDHLKIKRAHVVGYSMGAIITCKLLCCHPDRLLSATLGGAGGVRDGIDMTFFDVLAQSLDEGKGIAPLIIALSPPGRPKPTEDRISGINQLIMATNDSKALAAVVRGWKQLAVTDEQLRANKVPTLSIIGSIDPLKKSVDEVKERMPDLQIVVIDDADHMTAFIKPEFIKALKTFLARHSAASKGTDRDKVPLTNR